MTLPLNAILPTPIIAPLQEGTTDNAVMVRARYVSWFVGTCWRYWWPRDTWMLK